MIFLSHSCSIICFSRVRIFYPLNVCYCCPEHVSLALFHIYIIIIYVRVCLLVCCYEIHKPFNTTALGWAQHSGNAEVINLLKNWKA
jgi:hypothetical protein